MKQLRMINCVSMIRKIGHECVAKIRKLKQQVHQDKLLTRIGDIFIFILREVYTLLNIN